MSEHWNSHWLTFRLDPPDEEGTQVLTFIVGGRHSGGVAEGRLSWTGGASVPFSEAIAQRVITWVDTQTEENCHSMFGGLFDPNLTPGGL